MGVEACRNDDQIRSELLEHRGHESAPHGDIVRVSATSFERNIQRKAKTLASSDLRRVAGAWVERKLMSGHVEDARVVVENPLRAVAVVHVEVNNRDASRPTLKRTCRRNGGIVIEAEAHRAVAFSVMAGRADERKGPRELGCAGSRGPQRGSRAGVHDRAPENPVDGRQRRPRCKQRDVV